MLPHVGSEQLSTVSHCKRFWISEMLQYPDVFVEILRSCAEHIGRLHSFRQRVPTRIETYIQASPNLLSVHGARRSRSSGSGKRSSPGQGLGDRKSTRLNSSHRCISYAV